MIHLQENSGRNYAPERLVGPNPITEIEARGWSKQIKTLHHPTPAGYNDPVAITCVVDALLRSEHDVTIRTRHLNHLLVEEYPQLLWSPVTVGRILSELCEAAEGAGITPAPIIAWHQGTGTRYIVNVNQNSWKWFARVREAMGKLAERIIEEEIGQAAVIKMDAFPHDAIDAVKIRADEIEVAG